MAEISDYVVGPYQGVSQAPPQDRLAGTCDAMEDCIATIPNGIQKRPPFTWTKQLLDSGGSPIVLTSGAKWVHIARGDPSTDVTLLLNQTGGGLGMYLFQSSSMAAIAIAAFDATALAYLNSGAPVPNTDLKVTSVEDVTFITNRKVAVALAGTAAGGRPHEAFVWVKTGGFSRQYTVTVSPSGGTPVTAGFQSQDGASSLDTYGTDTAAVALGLYSGTLPSGGHAVISGSPLNGLVSQGFTVSVDGSLISISHPSNDFSIDSADGLGNTAMTAVKDNVQSFSDLPAIAPNGFTVRVNQSLAGGNADYYAQFSASGGASGGYWKEVIRPGGDLGISAASMPVGLTNTAGVWALVELPWTGRTTGDPTTSLDPDFLGDTIQDIGWWRGRLCLLANGSCSLSASDSPYRFYTSTLITAKESDPIGLLPPSDSKAFFRQLVLFDQRLIAFGDKMQGIAQSSGAVVTPTSTGMFPLSDSDFTDQVPTQGCNHKVYFAAGDGQSLAIYEIGIDRLSGLALPEELTPAVPTYLPPTLDRAATVKPDFITVYGTSGTGRFIVHVFRYAEQQRVQNAFFGWNLPTGWTIGGFYIKGRILYAAIADPVGNLHGATMDLTPNRLDPSGTLQTHLDMRVTNAQCTVAFTASSSGGSTLFTLPIRNSGNIVAAVRGPGSANYPEGYFPTISAFNSGSVTLPGDWRGIPLWFGYLYSSFFIPTTFYKMGQDQKPEMSGRLTIKRLHANVSTFGYLRAEVSVVGRATRLVAADGMTLGSADIPLNAGNVDIRNVATFPVPVGGKNEDVSIKFVNDSHLGFKFTGFEWIGQFTPRATRVT